MRILALVDRWSRGGVPTVIANHQKMVTDAGGEYRLYCYYAPDPDAPPMPEWVTHGEARFRGDPKTIFQFYRLLKTFQPDVIHDHFGGFWSAFYLLRPGWAKRSLLHYHNEYIPVEETPDQNRAGRDRLFFRFLMPRYAKILTVSDHNRQRIIKYAGIDKENVQTLPNSIDPQQYQRVSDQQTSIHETFDIPRDAFVVGTHGRLVYEKGIDTTVEVVAELIKREQDRPVWGLISGSGDIHYEAGLKEHVERLGISDRIIFTGYRSDIPDILAAMDLFLMPSRQEPFGLTILEAMAMRVPVVAVQPEQGGGPLEIIDHQNNGVLIPKRDPKIIADACLEILNYKSYGKQLSDQAYEDLKRFHPEKIGSALLQIYRAYC